MRAVFTNTGIYLAADSVQETREAQKFAVAMSFVVDGYMFSEAYRNGHWDGRERLVKRRKNPDLTHIVPGLPPGHSAWFCPVGLGENVLEKWPGISKIDARRPTGESLQMALRKEVIPNLRLYQKEAVSEILFEDPPLTGKGLTRLPTRSGKTVIAGKVLAELGFRGGFIVNSDMLLRQTVSFFKKALSVEGEVPGGLPLVGQWGGGEHTPGWITVASVQSMTRHLEDPLDLLKRHRRSAKLSMEKLKRKSYKGDAKKKIRSAISRARNYLVSVEFEERGGRVFSYTITNNLPALTRAKEKRETVLSFLRTWDVVFFDECHHLTSDLWRETMTRTDARFKVGLSATINFEKKGTARATIWLMASTGPVIYSLSPSDLIRQGWLCRPRIRILQAPKPREMPPPTDSFPSIYSWAIAENGGRNDKITETVLSERAGGRRVLVTVRLIKHAKLLRETMTEAGLAVAVITGPTSPKQREILVARLKSKNLDVIVGTVFKEAVDVPFLETVIVADGGASRVLTLQRLRNMTPVDKNDKVIQNPMKTPTIVNVFDFNDVCHRFVRKHSAERIDEYERHEEFIVEVGK